MSSRLAAARSSIEPISEWWNGCSSREARALGRSLPPRAVRLIVDRPASFVLHDIALRIELLLRHRGKQVSHAIRLEPERKLEMVRWHRLEIVRPIEPRRSVQRAAGTLHELEMLVRADVLRALEEHVFEQVSKSGTARPLVGRSDVVPEIHRNDRRGVVLGQRDSEAIREFELFDRDRHPRKLDGVHRRGNPVRLTTCRASGDLAHS